jgi:AcrR family transcriptional regulator
LSGRPGASETQLADIQRSRLLAAAVGAIDEFGYGHATVAQITSRARVSRRTFYELFENREQCLTALLEDVVGMVEDEIAAAKLDALPWRERVRGGLTAILSFLDREPGLAQVCVVQVLRGGPQVLQRREQILARLAAVLQEGSRESALSSECTALTAEGLVGAAYGIVYTRLLRREHRPLTELLGELMGMIVLPYLGPAAARREQARLAPAAANRSRSSARRADALDLPHGTGPYLYRRAAGNQQPRGRRARRGGRPGADLEAARAPGAPGARRQ